MAPGRDTWHTTAVLGDRQRPAEYPGLFVDPTEHETLSQSITTTRNLDFLALLSQPPPCRTGFPQPKLLTGKYWKAAEILIGSVVVNICAFFLIMNCCSTGSPNNPSDLDTEG